MTDSHPASPQGIAPDPWADLRAHTPARLALGRAGAALPTAEVLRFGLANLQQVLDQSPAAHSAAQDALQRLLLAFGEGSEP